MLMVWSFLVENVMPIVSAVMSSAAALAAIKIVFQAGEVVQHIKDIDARVVRLEGRVEAHGD